MGRNAEYWLRGAENSQSISELTAGLMEWCACPIFGVCHLPAVTGNRRRGQLSRRRDNVVPVQFSGSAI